MFSLTTGLEVKVGLVTRGTRRLNRIVLVILRQLLALLEHFLLHQKALLDPTLDASRRTHLGEAPVAVKDTDSLSILHVPGFVVDGSNPISEISLRCRHVGVFLDTPLAAIASRENKCGCDGDDKDRQLEFTWKEFLHRGDLSL
jgi:hypothetical protein